MRRCSRWCPEAQIVVAWIGGVTALLAAFIALTQTDLKRVLAYSTVSQLGYMFLALGTVGAISPAFAVTAAIFHLFTHAFFKALLFLAAGSVMHAMGDVIDMRRFGGLRKAHAGHALDVPVRRRGAGRRCRCSSGFWSKDVILEVARGSEREHEPLHRRRTSSLLLVGLLTAGLTAFYTFRAYFLTFWGAETIPEEAGHHAHESPPVMTLPLMVLAVGALFVGIVVEPFTHWFSDFLGHDAIAPAGERRGQGERGRASTSTGRSRLLSTALVVAGVGVAFALYRRGGPEKVACQPASRCSRSRETSCMWKRSTKRPS